MRLRIAAMATCVGLALVQPVHASEPSTVSTVSQVAVYALSPINPWDHSMWRKYVGSFREAFFAEGCQAGSQGVIEDAARYQLRRFVLTALADQSKDLGLNESMTLEQVIGLVGRAYGKKLCSTSPERGGQ